VPLPVPSLISNETGSDRIEDYAGLIRKRPLTAIAMGLCLLNLAGLPIPPAGFFAKVFIFTAGANIQTQFMGLPLGWVLVSAALITSVPAIYYYTRVVILMIVPEPSEKVAALPGAQAPRPWVGSPQEAPALALLICTVLVAAAGTISVNSLMTVSRMAVGSMALRTEAGAPISVLPKANSCSDCQPSRLQRTALPISLRSGSGCQLSCFGQSARVRSSLF
jgi:NADH:ubiquinone oxidoreductase subunit 2 (subunit N)